MAKKTKKRKRAAPAGRAAPPSDLDDYLASGEPAAGFSNLPQGNYEGFVKPGSAVIEPKDSGGDRAQLMLVVTSPEEHVDRQQMRFYDLTTQIGVNILLGELEAMELPQAKSKKELGSILQQTDNIPVRFWVGPEREDFPPKVRINERLEGAPASAGGDADTGSDYYTKEEIMAASEKELEDIIKVEELAIVPDDIDTWEEVAEQVCTALGI